MQKKRALLFMYTCSLTQKVGKNTQASNKIYFERQGKEKKKA